MKQTEPRYCQETFLANALASSMVLPSFRACLLAEWVSDDLRDTLFLASSPEGRGRSLEPLAFASPEPSPTDGSFSRSLFLGDFFWFLFITFNSILSLRLQSRITLSLRLAIPTSLLWFFGILSLVFLLLCLLFRRGFCLCSFLWQKLLLLCWFNGLQAIKNTGSWFVGGQSIATRILPSHLWSSFFWSSQGMKLQVLSMGWEDLGYR